MATYTSNKNIIKPTNGEYPDAWDVPINTDWDIIDKALGSAVQKTLSNVDILLTVAEAANQQIYLSGALTAAVTIIIPFQTGSSTTAVGGEWIVYNNTTGGYSVSMVTQVTGSTGVVLPQGYRCKVYSNQTNIAFSDDTRVAFGTGLTVTAGAPPAVSLTVPVLASLGGTGKTSNTANSVLIGNGTGALLEVAPGPSGNILTSNGTSWSSQAPTGGGGGGITSFTIDGGITGLRFKSTGSSYIVPTDGTTPTLQGTLAVGYGGTGNTSLTGYVKGSGTSALSAVSTIPGSDISGAVASATNATTASSCSGNAATATTATNLSGGTVNGTTGTFSSLVTGQNYTTASGTYGFGGSTTGTYGSAGFTVGWEIAGVPIFSCGTSVVTAGTAVTAAVCYFGTAWTNASDIRTKKDIQPYEVGLDAIDELRPVSFLYNGVNGTPDDGRRRVSFIAQEVQGNQLGSMVTVGEDGYLSVNTNDLIFALVNAVKELSARVEELEAKLA